MKKILLFAVACLCYSVSFSQSFNYQAVVRDATGDPVTNQSMGVLVRIIAGSPTGSVLYNEAHTVTSNDQGVITLPVGEGASGANFLAIDWSTQNHWIDIQVDLSGGTNYTQIGTSELRFVPYAMYALNSNQAGNAGVFAKNGNVVSNGNGNNVTDDFVFGSSQLDVNGSNSPALNNRMYFDKSKAAFRAGYTPGDEWDEDNVGTYSAAFGESAMASNTNSFAMGRNANATGNEGVAFGTNAGAFGNFSRGMGLNARAFGVNATAIGRQLTANSMAEIQLGQYSTFASGSADTWIPTDRLFVIGNGEEDINQALNSNALVMLKNGNTTLNGTFTIDGDNQGPGSAFTLPAQDGIANQIMQTDGSGNVTWVTPAASAIPNGGTNGYVLSTDGAGVLSWVTNDDADSDPTNEIELPAQAGETGKFLSTNGTLPSWQDIPDELPTGGTDGQVLATDGSGAYSWVDQTATAGFSTTGNVTSNASGDPDTDDFVFGSTQIDDIPGIPDNNRMVFDKSNAGAFRAGSAFNTNVFNQDQMGAASAGFGVNNRASGIYSFTAGNFNESTGYASTTFGDFNTASGTRAVAIGNNSTASGTYTFALGERLTAESYGQVSLGRYNTALAGNADTYVDTDRLLVIGNGIVTVDGIENSDALVMLKNGNTTLNGELTIDGDNQGMGASYTLPAQDGTSNQVMTTDGAGNVSWADVADGGTSFPAGGNNGQILSTDGSGNYSWVDDATGTSAFSTTANVTSNANGTIATDDFVFGSTQLDDDGTDNSGDETRLFFNKTKGAFRAGTSAEIDGFGGAWNDGAVGNYSTALGRGSIATNTGSTAVGSYNQVNGEDAFAAGRQNLASRPSSMALGANNSVSGQYAVGLGRGSQATSYGQHTLGLFSEGISGTYNNYVATDALFVIGNGPDDANRSNAFIMRKNGNTLLNGQLTIDGDNTGAGAGYTLPAQDGITNQVMTTDGSGNVSWTTAATSGAFSTASNVTSNVNGTPATDDFVFGSTQLADNAGTADDNRMFFDKSKAAFRAGQVEADEWDNVNVGQYSTAFGINTTSSEFASFAAGDESQATNYSAVALGSAARATGRSSVAMGDFAKAESIAQISLGVNNTAVAGNPTTHVATDRLFVIGNGITAVASDALVMLKNGNTTLNGQLTIDGDNTGAGASYTLPAQDGTTNQVMTTDGSGQVSWTTVQTLPTGGTNGQLLGVSALGVQWLDSDEVILDDSPTNEIELPVGGSNGQVLQTDGSGNYSWTENTAAPGAFTAATMNTGWQYYNAAFGVTTFQDPRFRKVNNVVTIEGLCRKNAAISNGETIMTLPVGFRPTRTRIFTIETENGAMRVDVNPTGTVVIATGFNVNQNWVSLDGLTFSID